MDVSESMSKELHSLLDRDAIMRLVARYLSAVDRMDLEMCRSTFHPDAWDEHGTFATAGVDQFLNAVWEHHALWSFHQHTVTHSLVDVKGNRGIGEHYLFAILGLDGGADREKIERLFGPAYVRARLTDGKLNKPHFWRLGGRYLDRYEKRDGEWRFLRRTVRMEWNEKVPGDDWSEGTAALQGRDAAPRDRTDHVYTLRDWLQNEAAI